MPHTHTLFQTYLPCCLLLPCFFPLLPFPFPLFSSLFLTLHSMPHLPICFFLATLSLLCFSLLFYSLIFNNINQSFCVDNVRATFDFGLFCVRSTTRKTFRPLLPIADIPPNGEQFIYVSVSVPSSLSILLPLISILKYHIDTNQPIFLPSFIYNIQPYVTNTKKFNNFAYHYYMLL